MEPKVLALTGDMDGSTLWRVLQPITELQRIGYPAEWISHKDDTAAEYAPFFDAVILPRISWPVAEKGKGHRFVRALHRAGLAVIFEVDDDMFSSDFFKRLLEQHEKSIRQANDIVYSMRGILDLVDGVTVSCQRLATIVRLHTDRPVKVVENSLDLRWFQAVQEKAERLVDGLTIGWAGGIRPDSDIEKMVQAWGEIAKHHKNVTFVNIGHAARLFADYVPADRIEYIEWMPIISYPIGLVNIDIGCCPLTSTRFNRAKTPIKAMEYAASGAAVVASPTVYGQIIEHSVDGYICETVDDWVEALSRLIEDEQHRKEMAGRLLDKVRRDHDLANNVLKWPVAWAEIVEDFHKRQGYKIDLPTDEELYALAH